MYGGVTDTLVTIAQRNANGLARLRTIDACQRPHSVSPRICRWCLLQNRGQRGHGVDSAGRKRANRAILHRWPLISEARGEIRELHRGPRQCATARIGHDRRSHAPHAIDPAQHIRLCKLRRRAAEFVPGAGINHQEAAVRVFDHVRRMEVAILGYHEVGVVNLEGGAARFQHVSRDLPHVEHRGEEVVAEAVAERARRVVRQPCRHGRTELVEYRHQIAGPLVAVDDRVHLAVQTAVDRVNQSVAPAELRLLDKCGRQDSLTGRR